MEPLSPQSPGLSPGDVIAGKFRLERVIGRGGMGAVWAARQVQLDMPVALKFIETEGDLDDARTRFEREARAAGQIRSPHVVQIIDHGIDGGPGGGRPYIAMELLEGEDLGERLRRERRIPVPAAARILTQAAKALRRAHEAGIIHRDLKPGNIFLARFDDDEVVKVLDFGVAKMRRAGALDEGLATQTGIVFGSPSYMSPEQARGARAIDHRSDLWSLAVIVFRAVTGVKPFHGSSIADLVVKLCIDPLPVATRVAPDLPPAIDGFFARAFARDLDQRFASAPEMAAAFEAVAVEAAPSPPSSLPAAPVAMGQPPFLGAPGPVWSPVHDGGSAPNPSVAMGAPAPKPPAPPAPAAAFPTGAAPPVASQAGGSGPHVAFAPGTLTPPPAPRAQPFRAPSFGSPPAEPTPGSGISSVPSGGWPVPPPSTPFPASPGVPGPVPHVAAAAPLAQNVAAAAPSFTMGETLKPPAQPVPSRAPLVLAASFGGGVLVLLLLVMVARQGSSTAASPGVSVGASAAVSAIPRPTPPPAPLPRAAVSAEPEAPASAAALAEPEPPASAAASVEPAPTASATAPVEPAPPTSTGAPRAPSRSGKKKKPNFGY